MATTSPGSPARLFTIQEAAEVLRIPISWLYERTRRNAIPCRRLGKYVRFSEEDLAKIMSAQASILAMGNESVLNMVKLGMNWESAGWGKKTRPASWKPMGIPKF